MIILIGQQFQAKTKLGGVHYYELIGPNKVRMIQSSAERCREDYRTYHKNNPSTRKEMPDSWLEFHVEEEWFRQRKITILN